MIYTGIGSRQTPKLFCELMYQIGKAFAEKGDILRSGNARGADEAFIRGAMTVENAQLEIFLPWKNFGTIRNDQFITELPDKAYDLAAEFHPNWKSLSRAGRRLMARNSMQVLGLDLETPAHMIICYTSDGKASGGTGQALRMAEEYDIPIYNMGKKDDYFKVKDFLN